jgi:hypothetical protein
MFVVKILRMKDKRKRRNGKGLRGVSLTPPSSCNKGVRPADKAAGEQGPHWEPERRESRASGRSGEGYVDPKGNLEAEGPGRK